MLLTFIEILYVKIATLWCNWFICNCVVILINVLFFWSVGLGVQPLLMETKTEATSNTESHSKDEEG